MTSTFMVRLVKKGKKTPKRFSSKKAYVYDDVFYFRERLKTLSANFCTNFGLDVGETKEIGKRTLLRDYGLQTLEFPILEG